MNNIFRKIFSNDKIIVNNYYLPSRGLFYPIDLEICLERASIENKIKYNYSVNNTDIENLIPTVTEILEEYINFNEKWFKFDMIISIDILFLFIELIKHSDRKKVFFDEMEFDKDTFNYFNYNQFDAIYDDNKRVYIFDEWEFKLPSIGIYKSLLNFQFLSKARGEEHLLNEDVSLIYFLKNEFLLNYKQIVNLIECYKDLEINERNLLSNKSNIFSSSSIYEITDGFRKVVIEPNMFLDIWV